MRVTSSTHTWQLRRTTVTRARRRRAIPAGRISAAAAVGGPLRPPGGLHVHAQPAPLRAGPLREPAADASRRRRRGRSVGGRSMWVGRSVGRWSIGRFGRSVGRSIVRACASRSRSGRFEETAGAARPVTTLPIDRLHSFVPGYAARSLPLAAGCWLRPLEVGLDAAAADAFLETDELEADVWRSYGATIRESGIKVPSPRPLPDPS